MKEYPAPSKSHVLYDGYFILRRKLLFSKSILKRIIAWFLITIWLVAVIYGLLVSCPIVFFVGVALISLTLVFSSTSPLVRFLMVVGFFDTVLMICSAILAPNQAVNFNPVALLIALLAAFVGFGLITPLISNTVDALGRGVLTWEDTEQCKQQMLELGLYSQKLLPSIEKEEVRKKLETLKEIASVNIGNNQMQSAFLAIIFAVITLVAPRDNLVSIWYAIYAATVYSMIIVITNMATVNSLIGQTVVLMLYELSYEDLPEQP